MLSEQQQRIMGYFIEEAKDHLNTIEQGLLNLQATIADPEMVNELFRAAHSVKGGAAMLGLTSIQTTSHRLEDYFKVLKECPIKIDQKLETLLLRVYDTLQELLEQLQGPFGLTDDKAEEAMAAVEPTFAELNQHLAQLVSQSGAPTPEDVDLAVVPTVPAVSRPMPVRAATEESALRFIFQNDVPARLREMLQLFKQADTPGTRQQLQSLCQSLAQPGEQLDLPDWCQLLDITERAIRNFDNTYRTLAPVVIKEIKRAQEQILTGNLTQVTASADLLSLVPPEPIAAMGDVTDTDLADLLGSTDEMGDQFDLFSEETMGELASSEMGLEETASGELQLEGDSTAFADLSDLDTAPELSFDAEPPLELTFDSLASEEDSNNTLDFSFIDQFEEANPALSNHQAGPEVGVAELNSLADLFEGEDPDLGLAWQEEVVGESVETEPEPLEFEDSATDFSDLLFQDSEALDLDESEEDLSGLLNKSAQQAEAEPANLENLDAFTFGEPAAEADLTDFDQALFSAQPLATATEPNFETDLFGQEAETADSGLDMLFSEANLQSQSDDVLGSPSFDALFGGDAESSVESSPADRFDFAELGNELEGASDADATPELASVSELDALELSDLDLVLDDADEMLLSEVSPVSPAPSDSLEFDPVLSFDSLDTSEDPSDLGAANLEAANPSVEADLGFWQPEAVADPWSEEFAQPNLNALNEPNLSEDLFSLDAESLDAETEDSSTAASWLDLELSEPVNPLDDLNSESELGVDPSEALEIESLNELDSAELNFQTFDDSTLEILNQPSLELTADEAANLDFNFDETALSPINSPASDPAIDLLTEDAESLDGSFDELATTPIEPTELREDEVVFHFGAPTESGNELDSAADGLDDLMNEFDSTNLELDLFAEPELEPIAPPTADLSSDLDDAFADNFTSGETSTADLDVFSIPFDTPVAADAERFDAEAIEDAEIEALLLSDSEVDLTADLAVDLVADGELTELIELNDLNLDEFALPDDFSELDSTTPVDSATSAEEAEEVDLTDLFTADGFDFSVEAAPSEAIDDAAFVESAQDVEPPASENPFSSPTLEALFDAEEELESPVLDFDNLDQFEMEPMAETSLPQTESAETDLEDQTIDMRLFDSDFSLDAPLAAELPLPLEATGSANLVDDLGDSDFDLFVTGAVDTSDSASEFDLEAGLLDSFDLDTELGVPDAVAETDSGLESPDFAALEPDDGSNDDSTDATEPLLDAAFSEGGIEGENLLEFAPDDRTDSASEDDLTADLTWADPIVGDLSTPLEITSDQVSVEPAIGEFGVEELGDEFFGDLSVSSASLENQPENPGEASAAVPSDSSLEFDFSDLEATTSSDFELETNLNDADLSDASFNDADLSMDALFNSEMNAAELNFESDFEMGSTAEATDEATLEFDLSLSDSFSAVERLEISEPEIEPLEIEAPDQATDLDLNAADLTTLDFDTGLGGELDSELDGELNREVDRELDRELNSESALNFAELDSFDFERATDASATPIMEGDLNDLDFGELFEADSLPEPSSSLPDTLDQTGLELEFSESPELFDTSLSETDFDDLDSMLADDGTVEMGTVSAQPAGFDDLEAMLAEDSSPTTAIHVEEDEIGDELETAAANEALNPMPAQAEDDFADLEALLDDAPDAEPAEIAMPISSLPIEVEDEFSDLEALLQDADQALGVGSSPTRKASTTANRRPSRRGGLNEQTMRVTVKHLDNLNNLVGEMVVNRNSLEQAEERLRQFLDNLLYQVQQLSDVGQRMRDLYERSLLESSLLSGRRGSISASISGFGAGGQPNHAAGMSFDALEMDRFTGFHVLSQEMIELIVRVRESASDIDFVVEETDQVTRNFRQITTQLQEGLTRSRMVPFSQTADRLPRGVRDNSLKYGKQAELIIEGRDTLIDKMIVEQLYDPMTHLVNNAIAHGIETPEERIAAGKSPTGQIVIRTFHQGNQTVISVSDDGAGINPERVRAKALAKGLINAAQAREMTRLDTYDLLFHHGFSTVDQIDDLRGRGVGLDVVRNNLNEIRGTISIDSTVGKGTTFTIRLPLTLSISKALCCISNRARIAFPMDGVEDMLDVPKERIQTDDQGRPCIQWRDTVLPFQPLSDLLRYNRVLGRGSVYGGNQEEDVISIVVLRSAGNYLALQVDQVLGEQEIVIKQLEGPVPKPLGVAGATVLGDGRIMPIADVLELIDLWQGRIRRESGGLLWDKGEMQLPPEPAKTESTVLIVDDSITVRELLSMTFNKVGYRVEQARDGQEAWEKLRAGLPCDLVFCDIEMPRMDGLELLSRIQKDSNLSHLPIAMLTSRGADRHRQMAVQLGAKGYFTKPYLEEVLLDAAQRMLKGEVMIPGVNTQ